MKRILIIAAGVYVACYIVFRIMNSEVWAEDGNKYVVYPQNPIAVYYVFRPLSYLDGFLTGMRSHIGPHQ